MILTTTFTMSLCLHITFLSACRAEKRFYNKREDLARRRGNLVDLSGMKNVKKINELL